jgi:hypothetical protein
VERGFAHCYDTGGMRRTHLRKHDNILKRQLIHVAGFNLGLIVRRPLGAGTPREWNNPAQLLLLFLSALLTPRTHRHRPCRSFIAPSEGIRAAKPSFPARSRQCRKIATYTTGNRGSCASRIASAVAGLQDDREDKHSHGYEIRNEAGARTKDRINRADDAQRGTGSRAAGAAPAGWQEPRKREGRRAGVQKMRGLWFETPRRCCACIGD